MWLNMEAFTDFSSECCQKLFEKVQEDFGRREVWLLLKEPSVS